MNTSIPPIIIKSATAVLILLAVFLLAESMKVFKSYRYVGAGISASNTITVTGRGEVFAAPDTATFTFTVDETASDVPAAQDKASRKINAITKYLKQQGIADADIQTTYYNINPQYQWNGGICMQNVCPPQKRTITGYEAMQTDTVKVHDITKAGGLLSGIGNLQASDVGSLTFTVADQDGITAQARDKAIAQARAKADVLAKSLGVSIVRVVGFSENSVGRPMPMMYGMGKADRAMSAAAPTAPDISTGQNKTTSDVSVTYEIQ